MSSIIFDCGSMGLKNESKMFIYNSLSRRSEIPDIDFLDDNVNKPLIDTLIGLYSLCIQDLNSKGDTISLSNSSFA